MEFQEFDLTSFRERYGEHEFYDVMEDFGVDVNSDFWIAGGAVRNLILKQPITTDVDFFFSTAESFWEFIKGRNAFKNEHLASFKHRIGEKVYRIQAININYFDDVKSCLDSFDFTICQFAVCKDKLIAGPYSMLDLAKRRLVLHKLSYAASTVRRLIKYNKQGFAVCDGVITSILKEAVANPDLVDITIEYVD